MEFARFSAATEAATPLESLSLDEREASRSNASLARFRATEASLTLLSASTRATAAALFMEAEAIREAATRARAESRLMVGLGEERETEKKEKLGLEQEGQR